MELDFILDYQWLILVVDLLVELGGDSMMGGRILDDQTLVALNGLEHMRFFDRPRANVSPLFVGLRVLLFGMRWLPPGLPVICKLFEKWRLDVGRLKRSKSAMILSPIASRGTMALRMW